MSSGLAAPRSFSFACGEAASRQATPDLVGQKAYNLMRLAEEGLRVPPGFVLTTQICREYFQRDAELPSDILDLLGQGIRRLEQATSQTFAGDRRPLLLSVRSGAPLSMPGMMDTILNVGLCDRTVAAMIRTTGNPRFVWDCYRRLVQGFAEVVHGAPADPFNSLLNELLRAESVPSAEELDVAALKRLTQASLEIYQHLVGQPFPQLPLPQLKMAVEAVLGSWRSERALEYRRLNRIDGEIGTAVAVQAMVFGNMGGASGSGVAFTRSPTTGDNQLYLDFLWNAQGEDLVSGRYRVRDVVDMQRMSDLEGKLKQIGKQLEQLFHDAQDFEFTVQEGQLYLLQTRAAKRTPLAALRIACDMVREALIDETTGLARLADCDLDSVSLNHLLIEPDANPVGCGTPASTGVAVGEIAFDSPTATALAEAGRAVILVRQDISTNDIAGLAAADGVLTSLGGRTSHAAVIARQLNKVCIVGCRDLTIGPNRRCRLGNQWFPERSHLSLDGHSGRVYAGQCSIRKEKPWQYLREVDRWNLQQRARVASAV